MDDNSSPPDGGHPAARLGEALALLTEHQANTTAAFDLRLPFLLETVARAVRVSRVSVWRFNAGRTAIECAGLYDLHANRHERGSVLARTDFPTYFQALEYERVIAAEDARQDQRTREFRDAYLTPLGIGAMLDVPLRLDGRTVGVVCMEHLGEARRWSLEERNFAVSAANVFATAAADAERQAALTRLAEYETRLLSILNTAQDAFIGIDAAGVIVEWNAQAAAMFGWTREDALGRTLADTIVPPAEREAHLNGLRRFRDTGKTVRASQRMELTALHRDGRELPVGVSLTQPLADGDGYFFGAFVRDLSERRRLEEELRLAREALGS